MGRLSGKGERGIRDASRVGIRTSGVDNVGCYILGGHFWGDRHFRDNVLDLCEV